ncbi:hypothetical protein DCC39_13380 [Pueribacillus theae]|uniref:YbbR-like domain-containing protein YbbR n=1 Tax=Pueribacillus theae TaxID=2171751 RepID=A0A2U1JWB3_9BACI|nr:CdaR family protein [Pueribacillus theae]PWA09249.1 hypothetical protein DCC39_13380 [Pueribacillus theae]
MDKLLKSNWFVILVSFILALMLYSIVAVPKNMQSNANDTGSRVKDGEERIENVPVEAYYDEEKYVVTGIPETAEITLSGSTTQIFMAKMEKSLEVYADLKDLGVGTHRVRLHHRGLSDGLDIAINPSTVMVTIEEKKSSDFPINIEYLNEDKLPEGYSVNEAIVTPTMASVYGSEEQLKNVGSVKGYVDLKNVKETFTKSIPIKVYDHNDNEIEGLSLNPTVIDVEVPITGPNKSVPIKINKVDSLPKESSIKSMTLNPDTVTVYGSVEAVESVDFVEATINLAKLPIKDKQTLTVDIPLPKGIKMAEPEQVEITIEIGKRETKTVKNIPLQISGLRDGQKLIFTKPSGGKIDVEMSGASSILEKIVPDDINAYVDATGLGEGKHTVKVKINGPQNIDWKEKEVTFEIK